MTKRNQDLIERMKKALEAQLAGGSKQEVIYATRQLCALLEMELKIRCEEKTYGLSD